MIETVKYNVVIERDDRDPSYVDSMYKVYVQDAELSFQRCVSFRTSDDATVAANVAVAVLDTIRKGARLRD